MAFTDLVRHAVEQFQAHLSGHVDDRFADIRPQLRLIPQDPLEPPLVFVQLFLSLPIPEWLVTDLEGPALLDDTVDGITGRTTPNSSTQVVDLFRSGLSGHVVQAWTTENPEVLSSLFKVQHHARTFLSGQNE